MSIITTKQLSPIILCSNICLKRVLFQSETFYTWWKHDVVLSNVSYTVKQSSDTAKMLVPLLRYSISYRLTVIFRHIHLFHIAHVSFFSVVFILIKILLNSPLMRLSMWRHCWELMSSNGVLECSDPYKVDSCTWTLSVSFVCWTNSSGFYSCMWRRWEPTWRGSRPLQQ